MLRVGTIGISILGIVLMFAMVGPADASMVGMPSLAGMVHVGMNLGEIPFHGSFKPGVTFGYYLHDLVYIGGIYQIADSIKRDDTSFNAKAVGLDGLRSSRETVGQRALLEVRLRPHRLAPFMSLGFVYNDEDTETMHFDSRTRNIGDGEYAGEMTIRQTRPAAWRPSVGFGYSYTTPIGLEFGFEWAGWVLGKRPTPNIKIESEAPLSAKDEAALRAHMTDEFQDSIFNAYHIFQMGVGYTF
ncbi:hypothetical protein KDL45_13405 [bacterium]|nr:hypothetical protein [bacterium]